MTKAQVKLHEVLNKNIELERQNQTLAEELHEAGQKGLTESDDESDPFQANSFKMPTSSPRDRAQTLQVTNNFKRRESKIQKVDENDSLNDSFQDFNHLYSSARHDRRQSISMSNLNHQINQA